MVTVVVVDYGDGGWIGMVVVIMVVVVGYGDSGSNGDGSSNGDGGWLW